MKWQVVVLSTCLLAGLLSASAREALAERLESNSYVIQFGNFNVTSGEKSSASYSVTDTVGQVGAGPYGEYGTSSYFVGGGFQYIYQIDRFSFTISDLTIDLGQLTPGSHSTDSNTLTITTRGAGGYTVYAYERAPLTQVSGNETIPNTTCDSATCSYTTAGVWSNQSIPGFGYNMSGHDIPAAFVDGTYYKAFADDAQAQAMQAVMSSANAANQRQATVTYKAGVSGSQASGNYETDIVFVAVPGF